MTGLVGWFLAFGSGTLLCLVLGVVFLLRAGRNFEITNDKGSMDFYASLRAKLWLVFGFLLLLMALMFSSQLSRGYLAKDQFLSKPLKDYGIYETVAYKRINQNMYVIILKDQTGAYLAYQMTAIPPKVFKVIPAETEKDRKREYQLYQPFLPTSASVSSSQTETTQVDTATISEKQKTETEIVPEMESRPRQP